STTAAARGRSPGHRRIKMNRYAILFTIGFLAWASEAALGEEARETSIFRRIKAHLDAVPAVDTHDHLWPFDRLPGLMETDKGWGMTLYGLWRASYFPQVHPPTPRQAGEPFAAWWARARHDFDDARAT